VAPATTFDRAAERSMASVTEAGIKLLFAVRDRLKSTKYFRRLYYNVKNAQQFSDLFEHDIMLADRVRTQAYHRAISRYVKEGDIVVDLGTGNGILSFFASAMASRKVYAIDHSSIIEKARAVARDNGLTNIEFVRTNSRDFTVPEGKADVIIHEQIGDILLNENMVANLLDLRDRVLKPGGRILPAKFELFIEPVQMKEDQRVPFIWEQRIEGIDFSALRKFRQRIPRHYFHTAIRPSDVDHLLGEPAPLISFDVQTMDAGGLPRQAAYKRTVTTSGRLDGFVLYFSVIFDDEIRFDTAPTSPPTHWGTTLLRAEAQDVREGDVISFDLTIDDITEITTWRWHFEVTRG
jgi:protein arginine N-methyltransferase 1